MEPKLLNLAVLPFNLNPQEHDECCHPYLQNQRVSPRFSHLNYQFGINLNLLGVFPNNIIPEVLNQYQIFILPSYYEGNPKVLLETMSCGLACIGINVYGISNILKHKENGYLCDIQSESIKKAIKSLHSNKDLKSKIGRNAREFIMNP